MCPGFPVGPMALSRHENRYAPQSFKLNPRYMASQNEPSLLFILWRSARIILTGRRIPASVRLVADATCVCWLLPHLLLPLLPLHPKTGCLQFDEANKKGEANSSKKNGKAKKRHLDCSIFQNQVVELQELGFSHMRRYSTSIYHTSAQQCSNSKICTMTHPCLREDVARSRI